MTYLRHQEDTKSIFFSFLTLVTYVLHWNLSSFSYFIFFISSLQAFQQAVCIHNFAHCSVFHSKVMNDMYGILLTILSGAPSSLYVPGHNETHHRHLETEKDVMRTTQMTYKYEALNIFLFFPTIFIKVLKNDFTYMNEKRKQKKRIYYIYCIENIILHFLLFFLFWTNPAKMLSRYFMPTLIGKYMIVTLNILQHKSCDPNSKYAHSRNFTGYILNFLFFNNGFHTQHHNTPGLHWSRLEMYHKKIEHLIPHHLNQSNIFLYLMNEIVNKKNNDIASAPT